jgi:peroxiredoxin
MRADIVPGAKFPDYELSDHTTKRRKLSELQGPDPMVLVLGRGGFCPKDRREAEGLVQLYREIEVGYCRLVTITTDNITQTNEYRSGVGAHWPFLSDAGRVVQKDLDIAEYTDPVNNPMIPHTIVLEPGLIVHKIYNGYWFFGRPTTEELRQDLRAVLKKCRPEAFSFLQVSNSRLRVLALKKAENSDEVIVRLVEMDGRPQANAEIKVVPFVREAREVDGQERPVGDATVSHDGALLASFSPYQVRTFALKLGKLIAGVAPPRSSAIAYLPASRSVATKDGSKSAAGAGFDEEGRALPAEMLPNEISYAGINFSLTSGPDGIPRALVPAGQTVSMPSGGFRRLYILAASADGDQKATFRIGPDSFDLTIQDWSGFIGQWDDRTWSEKKEQLPPRAGASDDAPLRMRTVLEFTGLKPGYIKRAPVAWFASHRHTADGANEPYAYSYLFAYSIPLRAGARSVILPTNPKIRILAITVSDESIESVPAQPLYDTLE